MAPDKKALALWLAQQQRSVSMAQRQQPPELHLHQHYHGPQQPPAPPPVAEPEQPQTVRLHPLVFMFSLFLLSIALSVPLALLSAIVDATNRPSVQYVQPPRGGW